MDDINAQIAEPTALLDNLQHVVLALIARQTIGPKVTDELIAECLAYCNRDNSFRRLAERHPLPLSGPFAPLALPRQLQQLAREKNVHFMKYLAPINVNRQAAWMSVQTLAAYRQQHQSEGGPGLSNYVECSLCELIGAHLSEAEEQTKVLVEKLTMTLGLPGIFNFLILDAIKTNDANEVDARLFSHKVIERRETLRSRLVDAAVHGPTDQQQDHKKRRGDD
ncbi:hypothetical protein IW146_003641 [Coemansia sp. RSA 922]|nr:hypothetical protein H4S03_001050 [Coemansia sp. S3946]KAJ2052490.1 hypothetical protein H4S04_001300 [Coemansia sp. S16]KAJ2064017.1 hypothetical protein GGI08_002452 [Coemansia sp. S2]KAJ2113728.1 hypothetical protein IW146_003641 [Coemansia sp. RSA 922]KAJ2350615.1 hypothetical protein GGH92_002287 [Coemansia sp. RSA 2673]